jgi:hypothetical protein
LGPAGLAHGPVRKPRANRFHIEIAKLFSDQPVMHKKRATVSDEKTGNCLHPEHGPNLKQLADLCVPLVLLL